MIITLTPEECLKDEKMNKEAIECYRKEAPYTDVVNMLSVGDSNTTLDDLIVSYAINASIAWKRRAKKATETNLLLLLNTAMAKYLQNKSENNGKYKDLQTEDFEENSVQFLEKAIVQHADNVIIALCNDEEADARMFLKGLMDYAGKILAQKS